jgi:hypothetical protein
MSAFNPDNLNYRCRECGQSIRGVALNGSIHFAPHQDNGVWLIAECSSKSCGTYTFVIFDTLNQDVWRTYPFSFTSAKDYKLSIPENIREDLSEATLCEKAGAKRAAVVLYRRVIQDIAVDKLDKKILADVKQSDKLWKQIDLLAETGFITKAQANAAHEIRHFGNFGAHPRDDGLDKVEYDELELIDDLVNNLIMQIYVQTDNIMQLKAKRDGALKD